ncbi:MAG TPA: hypothetical protein VG245_07800, partial [Candidatus Dormibacteraeota bacterium]|nr:hypothetical protein [Candidatus Dormibacteraeota bacterium]
VADAYGGWAAINTSMTDVRPDPISCCTSAAAPYVAGAAAAIILEARRILGDTSTGYSGPAGDPTRRIVARGPAGLVAKGPLADGDLTLQELRDILEKTAQTRPQQGRDDGLLSPVASGQVSDFGTFGIGANPFCQLCFSLPLTWSQIPPGPAYPQLGYGGVNEYSLATAFRVLRGETDLPSRAAEDSFMALDTQIRQSVIQNNDVSTVTSWTAPGAAACPASQLAPLPSSADSTGLPPTGTGSGGATISLALLTVLVGAVLAGVAGGRRRRPEDG